METNVILKRPLPGLSRRRLQTFVKRACHASGLKGGITVLLTRSREMRSLNSRFRGKDRATDVLSFPASATAGGFAGDIAIAFDVAARNARQLGHSVAQEVEILALHGLLHLAGYDHESDHGEMARKEQRLRARLRLPTGLIERSSNGTAPPPAAARMRA